MIKKSIFAAAFLSLSSLNALADCTTRWGQGASWHQNTGSIGSALSNGGAPCRFAQWAPGRGATITDSKIAKRPQNGSLVVEQLGSFVYTPRAGFKGQDNFTFTICGDSPQGKGCSNHAITATVK